MFDYFSASGLNFLQTACMIYKVKVSLAVMNAKQDTL